MADIEGIDISLKLAQMDRALAQHGQLLADGDRKRQEMPFAPWQIAITRLYARHGIEELWMVNLDAREVEVCRVPVGDEYTSVSRVGAGATLEPVSLPGAVIRTDAFFD